MQWTKTLRLLTYIRYFVTPTLQPNGSFSVLSFWLFLQPPFAHRAFIENGHLRAIKGQTTDVYATITNSRLQNRKDTKQIAQRKKEEGDRR